MNASHNPRVAHFDSIADKWDGWDDLVSLRRRLLEGLAAFQVGPEENVIDMGCGTGNLTLAILSVLDPKGRVRAVDISPKMIEVARAKVSDARATFHLASAEHLPFEDGSSDRIICFSVWPHLRDHDAVGRELARVLRPGGHLHVWHLASRDTINAIHTGVGGPVAVDILGPASETAAALAHSGFRVTEVVDDADRYLVTAEKPGS
jgi:ubiquinone/menaquinone biosynthesis C-methylase UbiE